MASFKHPTEMAPSPGVQETERTLPAKVLMRIGEDASAPPPPPPTTTTASALQEDVPLIDAAPGELREARENVPVVHVIDKGSDWFGITGIVLWFLRL
jgi:hypothetical protein